MNPIHGECPFYPMMRTAKISPSPSSSRFEARTLGSIRRTALRRSPYWDCSSPKPFNDQSYHNHAIIKDINISVIVVRVVEHWDYLVFRATAIVDVSGHRHSGTFIVSFGRGFPWLKPKPRPFHQLQRVVDRYNLRIQYARPSEQRQLRGWSKFVFFPICRKQL
jgi:hypothetical protein